MMLLHNTASKHWYPSEIGRSENGRLRKMVVRKMVASGDWSFGDWSFGDWSFGEWSFGEWTVYRGITSSWTLILVRKIEMQEKSPNGSVEDSKDF
jgi:hypothetical protein